MIHMREKKHLFDKLIMLRYNLDVGTTLPLIASEILLFCLFIHANGILRSTAYGSSSKKY
jgi:hypothetical protein